MSDIAYVCPETHTPLTRTPMGYSRDDGGVYPLIVKPDGKTIDAPNFLDREQDGSGQSRSLEMYDTETATNVYRNFLDWLFATFNEDEARFRFGMISRLRLQPGQSVLVTGCGLGDDIEPILDAVGPAGAVFAQDLSPVMIAAAVARWVAVAPERVGQIRFSAGNALRLPFADQVFDAAYHFGGINLFDSMRQGIAEMARVVRPGGRVVISDEGVAPWLRETDYAKMVITNNQLWACEAPIALLPTTAADASLSWVLGNCFWVIEFEVAQQMPQLDPNIPHKGRRGGTMWTRHLGQTEGLTPETKRKVEAAAAASGLSIHEWLEKAIGQNLGQKPLT